MKTSYAAMAAIIGAGLIAVSSVRADEAATKPGSDETVTVTGEVLDMACYIDHGARGEKHAQCAKTCIESGLPVGIISQDGKAYLITGEHKPLNNQLADYAAKTITVKGKLVERDGFRMIANAEIVK